MTASTIRSGSITPISSTPADSEGQSLLKLAPSPQQRTPLPAFQLFLLCIVRLAEPVASSQIFPYINDLCVHFGYVASEDEVGFISGLIDSLFAFVQLFTVMHWGRLSDRIGRKPVILLGLCGVTLATLTFGLSRSLWLTILARCLAGGLSGNGAVIQTMISEMTDETNEARAFPLYSLMWAVGCIVGPSIGGTLSRPADNFPSIFGGVPFWEEYPYFLPCLCSACITAVSFFTACFLKETLPSKARDTTLPQAVQVSYGTLAPEPETEYPPPSAPTQLQILRSRAIPTIFLTAFMMMFTNQSWDIVFILYAYTSVRSGGLSMSNPQIGFCLAGAGAVGASIQLWLFPRVVRKFGVPVYPWLVALVIPMFIGAPILNGFARAVGSGAGGRGDIMPGVTYAGVAILLFIGRLAAMVFPLNMILVKRSAPSKLAMGATYGMSQMVTASARAVSPWFVSSLFAFSIERNILGGNLIWLVMCCIGLVAVLQSLKVDRVLKDAARERGEQTPTSVDC
ncbi:MFS general substrate transporter [Dacryopinax primogenitus]|uniref:MFS general substrate transporter n=1 Tax=Dacryopinax primogenitus (strain DJM 731) TaxID=1858805 RepID=M5FRS5_DACPD|nr:MFS general substrate transporter [Dacryopinax primogenitus]EJT97729.1 MFS general substrate transporter [Dacryopinax primogenitus]